MLVYARDYSTKEHDHRNKPLFFMEHHVQMSSVTNFIGFHRKHDGKLNMSTALTIYIKVCLQYLYLLLSAKCENKKQIQIKNMFQQNSTSKIINQKHIELLFSIANVVSSY